LGEYRSVGPDVNNHEKEPRMSLNETQPENEPTGPRLTSTDRAVAAVERMMGASSTVGNAYADAYQEAVINMADLRGRLGDAGRGDRLKLVPGPVNAGPAPVGSPLRDATQAATRVNEQMLAASRQLSLAFMNAYEQAVRCLAGVCEEAATSTYGVSTRSAD
jgi:hypothetical protein